MGAAKKALGSITSLFTNRGYHLSTSTNTKTGAGAGAGAVAGAGAGTDGKASSKAASGFIAARAEYFNEREVRDER